MSRSVDTDVDPKPRIGRTLPVLLILALVIASGGATQTVFSTVQEAAKADLRLSDLQLSLVQGLATSLPLALLSIPLGLLVDRIHRLRMLIAMSAAWSVGSLVTAYAPGFPALFIGRMLAGLGASTAVTVAISLASDLSAPAQRGRAMLVLTLGKWAGTAAAFALGGYLLGRFTVDGIAGLTPWRGVHLAFGFIAMALTVSLLPLREPPRHERTSVGALPVRTAVDGLWARRGFLLPLFGGQVGVVMTDAAAAIWAAPVLSRSYGLRPDQFAGWMGAVIFGSGIIGSILGGLLADWGQRSGRRGGVLIGAIAAACVAIPAALFPVSPTVTGFAIALALLLTSGTITGLITATSIAIVVPNEMRGLCIGTFLAISGLIAFGVSPTLVTLISAGLGGDTHLGTALAGLGLIVSVGAAVAFYLASRRMPLE